MEFGQALEAVRRAFAQKIGRPLTAAEEALLYGAWNKLTYDRIAERSGYTINYLQRDIGPKFWKLLSKALDHKVNKTTLRAILTHLDDPIPAISSHTQRSISWGEALDVSTFHGRVEEIEQLTRWIIHDRCRLVAIVGMGGMGKSALAAKVAQQVVESYEFSVTSFQSGSSTQNISYGDATRTKLKTQNFEYVIWRSLRNAPSLETLLAELVPFLSRQQDIQPKPERLLHWLQTHRCLVILDNQDTLLQPGEHAGRYQPEFANYGDLFRMLGEASHQSCIVLTSREKSAEVALLEDYDGAVRTTGRRACASLSLRGSWEASLVLIESRRLVGTDAEKRQLCELYRCNPLALKMVASSIQSLFDGEIAAFLKEETPIFNGIRRLLDQQFERLSSLEQTIMVWLAINREWTAIAELQADIVPTVSRASLLESLESLTWRSLIERRTPQGEAQPSSEYTQQPVVMEYVTDWLIRQLAIELVMAQTSSLNHYALTKTTVLDYIRESQIRLILQPLIEQLKNSFHHNAERLEQHLRSLLTRLRNVPESNFGYGVGNFINLCLHLQIDLTGYDFSHSTIRHADLQGATLQQINFQAAHFAQSSFTQIFAGGVWVRFSPDGQRFAIGDTNGKVHIWHFQTMQPLLTIHAHQAWIWAAAWHPDGTTIATGVGPTVRLWDTRTGGWLRDLQGYPDAVYTLTWSPDGQRLACGGQVPIILVWDRTTGLCVTRLQVREPSRQSCGIYSATWLANGTVLAGAYMDHTIKLWDVASGNCIRVIQAHEGWVLSLALHPNGNILASSGYDKAVKLWDWQTGKCLQAIATRDYTWRLEWSPNGQMLAGGSADCTTTLWDCSLQCLQMFQEHQSWVWAVAWSRDSKTLATVSPDHVVKLWNTQTGHCVKTLQGHSNSSWCIKWSKDGIRLLSSSTNHTVQLWNSQTGECLRLFQEHNNEVLFVSWSPDERLIASCSADATVRIWDVETGRCLNVLLGHHHWVKAVTWSRDGNYVISSGNDQTVRLWDIHSGQCLLTLSDHRHQVNSVIGFPAGNRIASGSTDGTIRFWDLSRGVCDRVIDVNYPVQSLSFSPDGKTLASGDHVGTVKLWDVDSGKCLNTLHGHAPGYINSVTWSADGSQMASVCTDSTIRIWQVSTGDCECVIEGTNWGMDADWHPVSDLLAMSYYEQPIQLWDVKTGKTVQTLSRKLPYEGMNILGVTGISEAQKVGLKALGAIAG
ncbi:NB-ARC domain-containing protein [Leptolyngbyaceae cyanobacterium UHCC 1019]